MSAKLVAEEGILKGLVLSLDHGDQWVIGRDPDACQLLIEDPSASRRHIMCRSTPQGIVLENLSATNPVQVNDEEIKEPRLLHNGDMVKIGSGSFRFYAEAAAQLFKENEASGQVTNNEKNEKQPNQVEQNGNELVMPKVEPVHEDFSEQNLESPQDTIFDEELSDGKNTLAEIDFGIIETGRWMLKVIGGPNNGAEFSMQTGSSYIIGTDPNACDIVFHDTSVSRQHARITIGQDDSLMIEDLKSRNGTLVDGEPLTSKHALASNILVTMGTSSFVVFDREGEMQTIISPLLPSIVKVLQKEEPVQPETAISSAQSEQNAQELAAATAKAHHEKTSIALGGFILICIITGLFVIVGIGTSTLFKSEPIVVKEVAEPNKVLDTALAEFLPSVKYTFNKNTGRLLLVGHVLTGNDKNQLLYNLQGLNFIKSRDDSGIVVDEYVWREINQVLEKNPSWKGITVHANSAGHFVISGYLQTKAQADRLFEYMTANFPYLDLLEKKVVVDEDIISSINNSLQKMGLKDVKVQLTNGEVTLSGGYPPSKKADFEGFLAEAKNIPGVRNLRNLVTPLAPEQSVINITDRYEVTGLSKQGGNLNVIINGRILAKGDVLDGMTISEIKQNVIMLEKDGTKYRIDFSK